MNKHTNIITYSSQNKGCTAPVLAYSPSTCLSVPTPASPTPQTQAAQRGCEHSCSSTWGSMTMKVMRLYLWTQCVELQRRFKIFTTERKTQRGKTDKDQPFALDGCVVAFQSLSSFGHFGLLLSLLTAPKDLTCSHRQPLHKILKSTTDGSTEESFHLTFQIITCSLSPTSQTVCPRLPYDFDPHQAAL